jgi:hypothetical protein
VRLEAAAAFGQLLILIEDIDHGADVAVGQAGLLMRRYRLLPLQPGWDVLRWGGSTGKLFEK